MENLTDDAERGDRITIVRETAVPIACLVLMALVPSVGYYHFLQSANRGSEPSFLLGSLEALETAVVIWMASAVGLAVLLLLRMRSGAATAVKNRIESAFLSLFLLESVGVAVILIIFALNLLGSYEWSDASSYVFCLVPTATLVSGGIVFIEGTRFEGGIGRLVRRLALVLVAISVPWAMFIAAFGFLGFGGHT